MFLPEEFEHELVITLVLDLLHEFSGRTSENENLITYNLQKIDTLLLNQESELGDLRDQLAGNEHRGIMTRREMEDLEQFAHQLTRQNHPLADLLSRLATHIPPIE